MNDKRLTRDETAKFIINKVLESFNSKFNKELKSEDFSYYNISSRPFTNCGIELATNNLDDAFYIRVYIEYTNSNDINFYGFEDRGSSASNTKDKVHTYLMKLNPDTFFGLGIKGNFNFCNDHLITTFILSEDDEIISDENDSNISY